jgi:hypothetical protein
MCGKKITVLPKLSVPEGQYLVRQAVVHEYVAVCYGGPGSYHVQQKAPAVLKWVIAPCGLIVVWNKV